MNSREPILELSYCQFGQLACLHPERPEPTACLFFAYPSRPETSVDAMTKAIGLIRHDDQMKVKVIDWQELDVEGNVVFCEICQAMRQSTCVVLNCTDANFNVLFECGFAIGNGKPVWPIIEENISESHFYTDLQTLTTLGHSKFRNGNALYHKLRKKKPWLRKAPFPLPSVLKDTPTRDMTGLLYLKSYHDDEPSLRITEALSMQDMTMILDDPKETLFQPLSWYIESIGKSFAVVIHLESQRVANFRLYWEKCALVAGIAVALGRRVLLISEIGNYKPVDYFDLIKTYKNATSAEKTTREFIQPIVNQVKVFREYTSHDIRAVQTHGSVVDRLRLGEFIAENEVDTLHRYFFETPEFQRALEPGPCVMVGRKGTGKTANFQMITTRLGTDWKTVVCEIKPKEWELNQLLEYVEKQPDLAEKGYVLEALWKVMLLSEAIKACYEKAGIAAKAAYVDLTPSQKNLKDRVETDGGVYALSFTSRMIKILRELHSELGQHPGGVVETNVTAILHRRSIDDLQKTLFQYVASELDRFAIVIDNLDANWYLGRNYASMADILLALLGASRDIWRHFTGHAKSYNSTAHVSILTFFRSDVFKVMLSRARDPDKLEFETMVWDSVDSLIGIIEKRLASSVESTDVLNWKDLLEPGFSVEAMKAFLKNSVLPRPRDYIYLFQRVLYQARSRSQNYFTKRDFTDAMRYYSEYALLALSAESQPYVPNMQDLLLEFFDRSPYLTMSETLQLLENAGVTKDKCRTTVDYLIESGFLGYGIDESNYSFPSNPIEMATAVKRVQRYAERGDNEMRLKIHNAFHGALALKRE